MSLVGAAERARRSTAGRSRKKPSGAAISTRARFASTSTKPAIIRRTSTIWRKACPELHFLRQAYKDPTNPADGSWRFIYVNAAGQIIGSTKYANLQQMALMDANGGQLPAVPGAPGQPGVPASSLGDRQQQFEFAARPDIVGRRNGNRHCKSAPAQREIHTPMVVRIRNRRCAKSSIAERPKSAKSHKVRRILRSAGQNPLGNQNPLSPLQTASWGRAAP